MSIAGYFGRRGPEWRSNVGGDKLGIKVEGAVLAGEKSLEERLAEPAQLRPCGYSQSLLDGLQGAQ